MIFLKRKKIKIKENIPYPNFLNQKEKNQSKLCGGRTSLICHDFDLDSRL